MPVPLLRWASTGWDRDLQVYGMTECLNDPEAATPSDGRSDAERPLCVGGQPALGNEVKIVRDDGTTCGPEIWKSCSGRHIMSGYWNKHTLTAEVIRDGWMHTQDLGFVDDGNFVYVVDRKKDMIISGGENIYSWEVEEALRAHPDVAEVAVIAVPDQVWGESVKACVQLRPGCAATEGDLIEHTRTRIASYKKPRSIDFVQTLPRLFNGKIDKKALRAPYWQDRDRQVS